MQPARKLNSEKPIPTCYHFQKLGQYRIQCGQLKREKQQTEGAKIGVGNKTMAKRTLTLRTTATKTPILSVILKQITETTENPELSTHSVRPMAKGNTPERNAILEPMQQTDCLLGIEDRQDKVKINNRILKTMQRRMARLPRKI